MIIDASLFKPVIKAMTGVGLPANVKNIPAILSFSNKGIFIETIDPSKVMLFNGLIPIKSDYTGSHTFDAQVILKSVDKIDSDITFDVMDNGIQIVNGRATYNIPFIVEPGFKVPKPPAHSSAVRLTMTGKAFYEGIDAVLGVSEADGAVYLEYNIDEKTFRMFDKLYSSVTVDYGQHEYVAEEIAQSGIIRAMYPISFMKEIIKHIKTDSQIRFSYGEKVPLVLRSSEEWEYQIAYAVAPRIEE